MNRKSFESIPIPKATPNPAKKNGIGVGNRVSGLIIFYKNE